MPGPARLPVGRQLAFAAKSVTRAFDDALAEAGGSLPVWLVLISLKSRPLRNQVELAEAGEAAFLRLRDAASAFDERLRRGLTDRDIDDLERLLGRLERNVSGDVPADRG